MIQQQDIKIRPFRVEDEEDVIDLWHRCGLVVPHNDPATDIALKMAFQPDLFLVGEKEGRVVATVMAGYEGHRGWINYLAVSPDCQERGLGRLIMEEAEKALRQRGCPKINLQVRATNKKVIAFYEALGFSDDNVLSLGKRLK